MKPYVRPLSLLLALELAFSPLVTAAAELVVDAQAPASHRPQLDQAGNGVPIVQITRPSAAGVSMNQFQQFNIGETGLILNNAQQLTQTQLGGYIDGNPNLGDNAGASIIVNQVSGGLPSGLRGYAEVAGRGAEVIIANPNGITCDGCGFINTSRGVLTTGLVGLDGQGAIEDIRVSRGLLQIQGRGLNAGNLERLDLLSRALLINADLQARDLNIRTGANSVNYQTLDAQAIAGEGEAARLALDVSALGGMYANRIFMVGTEKGVGVNAEGMVAALAGDLTLSADGNIRLNATSASGDTRLESIAGDLRLEGSHRASHTQDLNAGKTLTLTGTAGAAEQVRVTSTELVVQTDGQLHAGIGSDGVQNGQGVLTVQSGTATNQGEIAASALTWSGERLENQGRLLQLESGEMALSLGEELINGGEIASAGGRLAISAGRVENQTTGTLSQAGAGALELAIEDDVLNQGVMAAGSLRVTGEHLDNQGSLAQLDEGELRVDLQGDLDNRGQLYAEGRVMALQAENLRNQAGGQLTQAGASVLSARVRGELANQGEVTSNGQLALSAATLDNQSGTLVAAGDLDVTAATLDNQSGTLHAGGVLAISSELIDNRNGDIVALATADQALAVETLDNRGGRIASNSNVWSLNVAQLDNSAGGQIGHHGNGHLQVTGLLTNDSGTVQSNAGLYLTQQGLLSNRGGTLAALGELDLQAQALDNQGGSLMAGGAVDLILAGGTGVLDNRNGGAIQAVTNLSLTNLGQLLNDGGRLAANLQLALDIDQFNYEGILDAGAVSVLSRGDILIGAGQVWQASGDVTLAAQGRFSIDGQLHTAGNYELVGQALTLGLNGVVAAQGAGRVDVVGALQNFNRLSAKGDLDVAASTLDNWGDLGGHATELRADTLVNHGLLFGRDRLDLYADSLTNDQADIFTFGNLSMQGRTGGASQQILNDHGLIRADGNLTFNTALFLNQGSWQAGSTYTVEEPYVYSHEQGCFDGNPKHCVGEKQRVTRTGITRVVPTAVNHQFAQLIAGGQLAGVANNLINDASYIGATGGVTLMGSSLNNLAGVGTVDVTTVIDGKYYVRKKRDKVFGTGNYDSVERDPTKTIQTQETITLAGATIESQGSVVLHFNGQVNNGTVDDRVSAVRQTAPAAAHQDHVDRGTGTTVSRPGDLAALEGLPTTDTGLGLEPLPPSFELPKDHGLFVLNPDPSHPYLIETNPLLTDYDQFISSDYLLDRLDWDSGDHLRRIGDGFYELTLIEQSLLANTGSRYLDGLEGMALFQQLMDNAVQVKEDLQLAPGVALNKDQVNRLTRSMIWMETRVVNGEELLVPVVYLSAERDLAYENGALIAGRTVSVLGDSDVVNAGAMQALETLTIASTGGGLTNRQGTLRAGTELRVDVKRDLVNQSGEMSADQVALRAQGNVRNETLVENLGDVRQAAISRQGKQAVIAANDSLVVESGGDIRDQAGQLTSGGELSLAAEGDVYFEAIEQMTGFEVNTSVSHQSLKRSEHLTGTLAAQGDLAVQAGGSLVLEGAQVMTGANAQLQAGEDIHLLAVADRREEAFRNEEKGSGFHSDVSVESHSASLIHQSARLHAGGDLSLAAGRDLTLYGSQASSDGSILATAGRDIQLLSAVDQDQASYSREKENSVRYKTKAQGHHQETAVQAGLYGGGDVALSSGGDVRLTGADLVAGQELRIGGEQVTATAEGFETTTGGQVQNLFVDALALQNSAWEESSRGYKGPVKALMEVAAFTMPGVMLLGTPEVTLGEREAHRLDQVSQSGSALAADRIAIETAETTRLAGADVVANDSLAIAANDIQIDAVAETSAEFHLSERDSIQGLGAKLSKDELRLAGVAETRETQTQTVTTTQWKGSQISAGSVSLAATNEVQVLASSITADTDLDVTAGTNIEVGGREAETTVTDHYEVETRTTSIGVKNAYVDTLYAVQAVNDARKAIADAEDALDDAEDKVAAGKLREEDLKYYRANLAAATANLAQATIAAAAAGATAAASTATAGFYATAGAQRHTLEQESETQSTTWQGSQLSAGGNAELSSDKQIEIEGSDVTVGRTLALNSDDIQVTAGRDTQQSSSTTRETNQGVTVAYGAQGLSGNVQAGFRNGDSDSSSLTHRNSQINAGSLTSTSDALVIAGAEVRADHIDIVTDSLEVRSLQNESQSQGQTRGGSAGAGFSGGGLSSVSAGMERADSSSERRWVDEQTLLIGAESVNIQARDTRLVGAVIAQAQEDESGQLVDGGNLQLRTETLNVADLEDLDRAETRGMHANVSLNLGGSAQNEGQMTLPKSGQTTVGGHYQGHDKAQTTRATIGGGTVLVGGVDSDIDGLNRDLDQRQEITRDLEVGGLNASVTVDHRLLTEAGRADVRQDFEDTRDHVEEIATSGAQVATLDSVGVLEFGSLVHEKAQTRQGIELAHSDQRLRETLNSEESTADANQGALEVLAQILTDDTGQELNLFAADGEGLGSYAGFYDPESGDVYLNVAQTDMTDALAKVEVLSHEAYHAKLDGRGANYSQQDEEVLATDMGSRAAQHWDRENQRRNIVLGDQIEAGDWVRENGKSAALATGNHNAQAVDANKVAPYLTPDQVKARQREREACGQDQMCQIAVERTFTNLHDRQAVERRMAQVSQILANIGEGVTGIADTVSSWFSDPGQEAGKVVEAVTSLTPATVAAGLNEMADVQHQALVDREAAFQRGDSEQLGRIEGDFATESLGVLVGELAALRVAGGIGKATVGKGLVNESLMPGWSVVPNTVDSVATRRAYLNEKFGRTGDLNLDINIHGRQDVATNFFRSQGIPEGKIDSFFTGIDFTQPVEIQTIGSGKRLWQYQAPGAPQGNWYSLNPSVEPTQLGISPYGFNRAAQSVEPKVLNNYVTTEPVSVLRSTSAAVDDFWSVSGQSYPATGGATQLFSPQKQSFILMQGN